MPLGAFRNPIRCVPLTIITGCGSAQAPVAERPLALPPEKGSATVDHPLVLECAAATAECTRQLLALDNRAAASDRYLVEMLRNSRDVIGRSRQLLSEMPGREK
jgi:hypothetical protein